MLFVLGVLFGEGNLHDEMREELHLELDGFVWDDDDFGVMVWGLVTALRIWKFTVIHESNFN